MCQSVQSLISLINSGMECEGIIDYLAARQLNKGIQREAGWFLNIGTVVEGVELYKSSGKLFETGWFGFKRPRMKQLLNDNHLLKVSYSICKQQIGG